MTPAAGQPRRKRAANGTLRIVTRQRLKCPACDAVNGFKREGWREGGDGSRWRYVACACGERFEDVEE